MADLMRQDAMTASSTPPILVVDDHPLFRDGLGSLLGQLLPGAAVLGADDAQAGLQLAERHPDIRLVLIDRNLPRMNGLAALPLFRQLLPAAGLVVVSADEQAADARAALAAGAQGFLPKSARPSVIQNALKLVLDGSVYVPPLLLDEQIRGAGADNAAAVDEHGLTQRQRQVLEKLCAGCSNKEIARDLHLAENTVKVHISAIFRALNIVSRTQAILAAHERNIV
jgi:two-component system, NarL family, nitrate/nitrite response regulator NarL